MPLLFLPRAGQFRLSLPLRRLLLPVAASLIVHALLFWPALSLSPSLEAPAGQAGSIRAKLQQAPVNPPQHEAQPAAANEAVAPREPEERSYARAAPPEEPVPTPSGANAPAAAEQSGDNILAPVRPGINLAGLRQYHLALGQMARQFKRYPPAALEAGLRGRVAIRVAVAENGRPLGLTLIGSSGYPLLDQAALDMMRLAASHTEVPEILHDRAFTIDLAVDFNPEDAP